MRLRTSILLVLISVCANAQFKTDRLITSGRVALHYEDYVLSIQYFNQVIALKPYLWEPWQLRAIAKYYLEDWNGTESDATNAIKLNPYITGLYDLRGIARIRQERYDDASDDYTKAIALNPDNRDYWYNRAACYVEMDKLDIALLQLDTIIKRWEKYVPAYLLRAETHMKMQDTLSAEKWVRKSLEVDSFNANAWRVMAHLALKKEQWKDADDYLTRMLHLKPRESNGLINRALARLKLHNLRGAMSDYDDALEYDPNNILAHYNRGLLRERVGDDNKAIEDFDFVLEYEPDNVIALFNRATLLDRTGDLKAAIRDYTKVINQFPNFWTGLKYRAECYRKMGQIAKAEKDEFRILKAQLDKRQGKQQRWSSAKIDAVRKMSDIDPEKYNQVVVEDDALANVNEYKSEYRGRIQNRKVNEQYQPYLALTMVVNNSEMLPSAIMPYDENIEQMRSKLLAPAKQIGVITPQLGLVGNNVGVPTDGMLDRLSELVKDSVGNDTGSLLLLMRAIAHSSSQNYNDAISDLKGYLELYPTDFVVLWQKTVCASMVTEYSKGLTLQEVELQKAGVIGDYEQLLKNAPTNALVLYCYGTFAARMQDYDKAIDLLTQSIALNPQVSYAYYNRALAYIAKGMVKEARIDLSKAGEMGLYNAYSLLKKSEQKK